MSKNRVINLHKVSARLDDHGRLELSVWKGTHAVIVRVDLSSDNVALELAWALRQHLDARSKAVARLEQALTGETP